ncbi:MAG: ABC transporter ATP-binding protein [Lachnospiraceae bacterium]|nr:ABC transporter ATP-binding protein [Lachnospiraceae bacterium]
MLGEVVMDLWQPRLMSVIVDDGVLGLNNGGVGNLDLVINTGLQMIGLVAVGGICGVVSGVFANLCSQNFGNDLRKDTFEKVMSFSFAQTDRFSTGSLVTRVTNDITQVQNLVSMSIRGFVRTFLLFAGGIVCMLSLNMQFGTVVFCAFIPILFCVVFFMKKADPMFGLLQTRLDKVNHVMQENVSGARVVKAYVREEYETERFREANQGLVGTQLRVLELFSYMTPIMNVILNISVVAVIKVGGILVEGGEATPGNVMAAITYISQILNAVMRTVMIFQSVSRGSASAKRIREVLECPEDLKDGSVEDGNTSGECRGEIRFEQVSFVYPEGSREPVLRDIDLTIHPGETFGIIGATGCGKSTLVNLIPRFFDATKGNVFVDGKNVRDYKKQELRNKVAIALQKSEIYSTTVRENILWGNPQAGPKELEKAAKTAQAWDFIQKLPEGLDTVIAQQGMSLSGGQKQRIAISRGIIRDGEILILDDATSALDLKTEADLYQMLSENYGNMTKVIIAQRIASIRNADRIAVMENGRIAACDSHERLLETCGIYREIYQSQLKDGGECIG